VRRRILAILAVTLSLFCILSPFLVADGGDDRTRVYRLGRSGEGLVVVVGPEINEAGDRWVTVAGELGWPWTAGRPIVPVDVKASGEGLAFSCCIKVDPESGPTFIPDEWTLDIDADLDELEDGDTEDDPIGSIRGSTKNGGMLGNGAGVVSG
jgi:hypothetical protein